MNGQEVPLHSEVVLGAALGVVYVNKTKGGLENIFSPAPKADSWMRDDPGWNKMPQPRVEPTPPPTPTPPTPPQPEPPQQPNRRPSQRLPNSPIHQPPNCPPNG